MITIELIKKGTKHFFFWNAHNNTVAEKYYLVEYSKDHKPDQPKPTVIRTYLMKKSTKKVKEKNNNIFYWIMKCLINVKKSQEKKYLHTKESLANKKPT